MTKVDKGFYEGLMQYNISIQNVIQEVCQFLPEIFGITSFCYARFFNNGYYLSLSNDFSYQKLYIERDYMGSTDFFKTCIFSSNKNIFNKVLWPLDYKDDLIIQSRSIDLVHNINIIRNYEDSLESFFFGAPAEKSFVRKLYTSHSVILENFIYYFLKKIQELIDISDKSKLGFSPFLYQNFPDITVLFRAPYPYEQNLPPFTNRYGIPFKISPRESECLRYLASGRSAKEIASFLKLSPRTIEKHLENLRQKTQSFHKMELIYWFEDHLKPLLE